MFTIRLLATGMFCILIACSTPDKIANAKANKLNVAGKENSENKILFPTLNIRLVDSASDAHVSSLVCSALAPGRQHQNAFRNIAPLQPYYLNPEITGDDKKEVILLKVQNPLLRVIEYSPEPGVLDKKFFVKKSGEIYLNIQFSEAAKYLAIYNPNQICEP